MASSNKVEPTAQYYVTGKSVKIRVLKTNPLLMQNIKSRMQEDAPKPPKMALTAPGGTTSDVEDTADADYQVALDVHLKMVQFQYFQELLEQGTELELTPEQQAQVTRWREKEFRKSRKEDLRDDKDIFIQEFACDHEKDDLSKLIKAVMQRVMPTAEQQEEANRTFRG